VLLILAARPFLRKLLVLDEPFAHVSPEFRSPLAEMMKALVDRLDFQVIMITQEREYVQIADKALSFNIVKGATETTILKDESPGHGDSD
jgi:ABC-type nitrate/sulfonate/bicarbonate transport system ATPase subunit